MTENNRVKIVVLAAGKGTRMKSELPKVLAPLKGKPMISWLLQSIKESGIDPRPTIVVGYKKEMVMESLGDAYNYAIQEDMLGTGHAVQASEKVLKDAADHVLVLNGDNPYISPTTIKTITDKHLASGYKVTTATVTVPDFTNERHALGTYGRIIRDETHNIIGVVENKDATEEQRKITEVNPGTYIFEAKWLWENLRNIKSENAQKEYYLTDLIKIAADQKEPIESISMEPHEALAANSKEELAILEKVV